MPGRLLLQQLFHIRIRLWYIPVSLCMWCFRSASQRSNVKIPGVPIWGLCNLRTPGKEVACSRRLQTCVMVFGVTCMLNSICKQSLQCRTVGPSRRIASWLHNPARCLPDLQPSLWRIARREQSAWLKLVLVWVFFDLQRLLSPGCLESCLQFCCRCPGSATTLTPAVCIQY